MCGPSSRRPWGGLAIATTTTNSDADAPEAASRPEPPKVSGGWITKLISLAVSIAIVAVLWATARQEDLLANLAEIHVPTLLIAVLLMPLGMMARGARFDLLLGKSGRRIGLVKATTITFIGTSLNVLLPSNLGDVAKSYYAYRYNLAKEVALSVVIIDKAFGMTAAMLVGMFAALSEGMLTAALLAGVVAAGLVMLIFVPQLIPWRLLAWLLDKTLGKKLRHDRALEASRFSTPLKLAAIGLSFVACSFAYAQYYVICRAMGLDVPLLFVWVTAPLMDLSKAVPLTANGLGTREAVAAFMLARVGVARGDALLSSLVFTATSLWLPALIGAPFVWLALSTRGGRGSEATRSAAASSSRPPAEAGSDG